MTWGKATPVLIIGLVGDVLSAFFAAFWLFGPALAGVYCVHKVSGVIGMVWGAVPTACGVGATALGYFGSGVFETIGAVMAMLVGGIAWGTVAFILVMTNPRVLKENAEQTLARSGQILRFIVGFVVDQVPIINVIPTLFPILWWMYRTQIKKEKAALAEYNKKKAALEAQERQEKIVQFAQYRAAQAEAEQEEILDAERGDEESTEELLQAA